MAIQVRVISQQALAQLQGIEGELGRIDKTLQKSSKSASGFFDTLGQGSLTKFGNQLQWTGRQLQYNFSLPIALAGIAATKFALDNEKAFTRIAKVYGDFSLSASTVNNELAALKKTFEALSEAYGVQQKEVLDVAADWAAAGASGLALAKAVDLTMKTMILGEMDATDATKALISIQAQYRLSTAQMMDVIAKLNIVENQTGISLKGLIEGFQRAAGVARNAGIDVDHLAALLAALTPAAGSATNAGNALKTIISRLLSPTKEANEVMKLMGINTSDMGWKSVDAGKKIEIMAKHFEGLDQAQKGVVSSTIASRYQINRFDVLMDAVNTKTSYYHKALEATRDKTLYLQQAEKELNKVLESNPRKLQQIWVILQNAMANVIQPLIPVILMVAKEITSLVLAFRGLSPEWQKAITFGLILLALFGPMIRYAGSLMTLFSTLGAVLKIFAGGLLGVGKFALAFVRIPLSGVFTAIGATAGFAARGVLGIFKMFGILQGALSGTMFVLRLFAVMSGLTFVNIGKAAVGSVGIAKGALIGMQKAFLGMRAALFMFRPMLVLWQTTWASAFGLFSGFMLSLQRVAGTGMVGLRAIWSAGLVSLRAATIAFGTAISTVWSALMVSIRSITMAFGAGLPAVWGATLLSVQRMTAVFRAANLLVWRTHYLNIQRMTAVFGIAFTNLWKAITLAIAATQALLVRILPAAWVAAFARMGALMVAFGSWAGGMWTAVLSLLRSITAAVGIAWSAVWAGVMMSFRVIMAAQGIGLRALWALITLSLQAISVTAWKGMRNIWMFGMAGLARVTKAMGAGIVGLWRATVFAIGVLMAAPGKFAAIWRAGWALIRSIYIGAIAVMSGLGKVVAFALSNPWILAIVGILALIVIFKDDLIKAWNSIVAWFQGGAGGIGQAFNGVTKYFWEAVNAIKKAFWSLPEGVTGAFMAVLKIVQKIAMKIYEWMSYLNPFARHSPSLVDNVTRGVAVINSSFGNLNISGPISRAYRDIDAFSSAMAKFKNGMDTVQHGKDLATITKVAPGAAGAFKALVGDLQTLQPVADRLTSAINAQQQVVDKWKDSLDAANDALDAQQKLLDIYEARVTSIQDNLDAATAALKDFADTPIQGEKAMGDAIFSNEMAQKRLRLEMMKMEDAVGPIDDLQNKLSKLQGEIETLQGKEAGLRQAGAGSDVLKTYDDQIASLRAQQTAAQKAVTPYQEMQDELDKLQKKGDQLDLENSLKFDPLHRQIDDVAKAMKELPFDEIMTGARNAQAQIDQYSGQLAVATKQMNDQKAVVDQLTASRDAIQVTYDAESKKLDNLQKQYSKVNDAIQAINSSLSDMVGLADQANQAKLAKDEFTSPGAKAFLAAKGGNFPVPGGTGDIGREGGAGDQSALIDQFTQDLAKQTGDIFSSFDIFKPIKEKWNQFVAWSKKNLLPIWNPIKEGWNKLVDQIDFGSIGSHVKDAFSKVGTGKLSGFIDTIKDAWDTIKGLGASLGRLFGPEVKRTLKALKEGFSAIWEKIGPELKKFVPLIKPLGEAVKNAWKVAKVFLAFFLLRFLAFGKILWSVINGTIKPTLEMIGDILKGVIKVIRGIIEVFIGIFTGDWAKLWQGIKDIFGGTWDVIWGIFKGFFKILWGGIKGFVEGIINFFLWLWDELVGHSIIPDMIDGIIAAFEWLAGLPKWIYDKVIKPIYDWFVSLWKKYLKPVVDAYWDNLVGSWDNLKKLGQWIYDKVLKPIIQFFKDLWPKYLKPGLQAYWDNITGAWDNLKKLGKWVYDKALKPIIDWIKSLWPKYIKPGLQAYWDNITGAWDNLKKLGKWIWDHALKPIWDKFGDAKTKIFSVLDSIKNGFDSKWTSIGNAAKKGINFAIDAINTLIDGLNKVAEILPGISWHIGHIPRLTMSAMPKAKTTTSSAGKNADKAMARGGSIPPFITNGARAIVGEGRRNYPEYVIPTDPRYRNRAMNLLSMAGADLGGAHGSLARSMAGRGSQGIPMHADGGILGTIRKNAVNLAWKPFSALYSRMADKIHWSYARKMADALFNSAKNWVSGENTKYNKSVFEGAPGTGNPSAAKNYAASILKNYGWGVFEADPLYRLWTGESGWRWNALNKSSGAYGIPQALPASKMRTAGADWKTNYKTQIRWGLGYIRSVYGSPSNALSRWMARSPHWYESGGLLPAGIPALREGALIRRSSGGSIVRVGEGNRDEAVVPLPRGLDLENMGHKEFHFHGDLSFPNIHSGDDAEKFIKNLEVLARDH